MTINATVKEAGFKPASRISSIGVSEILKIGARAQAMKREGKPVIILGQASPTSTRPITSRTPPARRSSAVKPSTPRSTARRN